MNRIKQFWVVFKADTLKILRDKITLALIISQAIITMLLIGITFNAGIRDIPIVVVQKYHDPVSNAVVSSITASNQFQVVAYVGSEDEAKRYINEGKAQGAIVINSDLTSDLFKGKKATVKILVDGSNPMVQYTFRALGMSITNNVQQRIYENIIDAINTAIQELQQSGSLAQNASALSGEISRNYSKYKGYKELATPATTAVLSNAGCPVSSTLLSTWNGATTAQAAALSTAGTSINHIISGYGEAASVISPIASYLIQKGYATGDLNLIKYGYTLQYLAQSLEEAEFKAKSSGIGDSLKRGGVEAGERYISAETPATGIGASLQAPPTTANPNAEVQYVLEMLRALKAQLQSIGGKKMPTGLFSVKYDVLYNGDKLRVLDLLAPTLIALFVAMATLATTAPMVVRERERGVLERISTTPIPPIEYISSKILAALAVTTVQEITLILVGVFLFRLYIGGGVWALLFILFPVALSHIGMGILVSTYAKTEREAVQAIPAILVPSIILSGMFIPISMLPTYIRPIAYLLPLTYCQDALTGVMVKGGSLAAYSGDIVALFAFALIFLAGGVLAFVRSTKS